MRMRLADFDYYLPPERIAQRPLEDRSASRLLVLGRDDGRIAHRRFVELPDLLGPRDVLVFNESRVLPARLRGRKPTGGLVEALLVRPLGPDTWSAMTHPGLRVGQRVRLEKPSAPGSDGETGRRGDPLRGGKRDKGERAKLRFSLFPFSPLPLTERVAPSLPRGEGVDAEVVAVGEDGLRTLRFAVSGPALRAAIGAIGETPTPPYIHEPLPDPSRYQTVYARHEGSVAAPTAGLHFTPALLDALRTRGVGLEFVTLHVGPGTFAPVKVEDVREHRMHPEWYALPEAVAERLNAARREGRRIVAVGTTVVRTLEAAAGGGLSTDSGSGLNGSGTEVGGVRAGEGETRLFIVPGYRFRVVDALLTNFHLPRSTLLMLVCAFAGRERVLAAYAEAVRERYRFYSFGDAMLVG
ncbi:MAG: tRNA preQ1(34) S-adenosylmethionine ribosyltransferase-isomerase QueA [Chloroflexi bacterium]|nr:tRNA preQ1(34) S-adenosylmethionine ribosyltransferase-isomerase QueA [Chloroflexota bacterium]